MGIPFYLEAKTTRFMSAPSILLEFYWQLRIK
jgi:hypothetical protein